MEKHPWDLMPQCIAILAHPLHIPFSYPFWNTWNSSNATRIVEMVKMFETKKGAQRSWRLHMRIVYHPLNNSFCD
ncbi:hypothetical protein POVWA2_008870 [Plasmodium ovale wallikeri]|uniref:Uncharacterized protein n=1 Tax=Plasmodium ovale wallikeri TaxID=864142 RepID=A0A1A8YL94_PLAOA|nr:hypothetical protein POVWA2_008870 [Plasmodium ovale wallikeri]